MLGTAHILMIHHGLYRSLPHREGGGMGGTTDPGQELRRQICNALLHSDLVGNLVRLRAGLPIHPEAPHISQRCGFKSGCPQLQPRATKGSEPHKAHRRCVYLDGKSRSWARSSATIVAAALRASSERSGGNEIAPTRACPPPP
jgi:hypothetical protein